MLLLPASVHPCLCIVTVICKGACPLFASGSCSCPRPRLQQVLAENACATAQSLVIANVMLPGGQITQERGLNGKHAAVQAMRTLTLAAGSATNA